MAQILLVDHFDSFTWNLWQALEGLGAPCEVVQSEALELEEVLRSPPRAIVLSPGPCSPLRAGASPALAAAVASGALDVPLLGICLGHQVIAHALGAEVVRAARPVHGRTTPILHDGLGIFAGLPEPLVQMRYHSLVVDPRTLPEALVASAWSEEGELMALRHRDRPIDGVQFHPESFLSELGVELLARWVATLPS